MPIHDRRELFDEDLEMFRNTARRFMQEHIVAHRERFDEAGIVDREVWLEAGRLGLLGAMAPEEHGGSGLDHRFAAVVIEEQVRAGASGPGFTLHSNIALPYIVRYGTEEQRRRWVPPAVTGEAVLAIGMTEPGAGSDLQRIRTTARRDGEEWVIDGSKIFITNGIAADMVIVACKTDPTKGAKGISLILVETDRPGFRKGRNLVKLGMKSQDTAELFFDEVRVPVSNLLGGLGEGFALMMTELPWERMQTAIWCTASCEAALEQTIAYTRERQAFGKTIFDFQNTRFRLAEMATETEIARCFVDRCIAELCEGRLDPAVAAMAKYWTSDLQGKVLDGCLQFFGGYGYMWEYDICRAFADARINRIWGGTNEIMKEIIARRLG